MKLPNADRAIVDIRKLEEYCLNPQHFRNKARVFAAVGITLKDAEALRLALLAAAVNEEAIPGPSDRHGERYVVDFNFTREG